MSARSRRKGSAFELQIARDLDMMTGVRFQRNLEQSREAEHGDLVPDDPAWPFLIECKRRATGISCLTEWKEQASTAAAQIQKTPAVVFKFDRQPIRVAVPISAICEYSVPNEWVEISLEGLAYIAREIMASSVMEAAE